MQMQPEFVRSGQTHCALPADICATLAGPLPPAKPAQWAKSKAVAWEHVVAVLPPPPPNGMAPDAKLPESPIPRRYRDLGKTPLKCDVVAGKNEFPIELVK
jgi:hypothetical protein